MIYKTNKTLNQFITHMCDDFNITRSGIEGFLSLKIGKCLLQIVIEYSLPHKKWYYPINHEWCVDYKNFIDELRYISYAYTLNNTFGCIENDWFILSPTCAKIPYMNIVKYIVKIKESFKMQNNIKKNVYWMEPFLIDNNGMCKKNKIINYY
jgi:hypothetical protein